MPVSFKFRGGKRREARGAFGLWQHSGAPEDVPHWIQTYTRSNPLAGEAQGTWLVMFDGQVRVNGHPPSHIEGRSGPGGFGFGGLNARLDVLNQTYTADRSFEVEQTATGDWLTEVDGRVVEEGEFHPYHIRWEQGAGPDSTGWF